MLLASSNPQGGYPFLGTGGYIQPAQGIMFVDSSANDGFDCPDSFIKVSSYLCIDHVISVLINLSKKS